MSLDVQIDNEDVVRLLDAGRTALDRVIDEVAGDLLVQVASESGSASSRVAASWRIEEEGEDRRVVSDEFFATFLARGTAPHGPRSAERMLFVVDGRTVAASFVSGVRADPFDERAIQTIEGQTGDIIDRLIAEVS